jgi:hypothetical protein
VLASLAFLLFFRARSRSRSQTRLEETAAPDGPASVRADLRSKSHAEILAERKKEEQLSKNKVMSESQLRSQARAHERKFVEGMAVKFEWNLGEPMPYGERDRAEDVVEGPARERFDKARKLKKLLMEQPHNLTDQLAYAKGNVLEELQAEQRSGRISKALKYVRAKQHASEARTKIMPVCVCSGSGSHKGLEGVHVLR